MLPKIDLHCHMDGSVPLETLRALAAEAGLDVPEDDMTFQSLITASDQCHDLTEYLSCFRIPLACLNTANGLKRAAYDTVQAIARDNVIYTELRFAPLSHVSENLTCRDVVESVLEGMKKAEQDTGILTGLIVCGMRHEPAEKNIGMLQTAREYMGSGLLAADIAGGESAFPTMVQKEFFREARRLEMPFTIHAGECGSVKNVLDAIEFGASRIGHGIALAQSAEAMAYCRTKQITLEMCPVSNIQTKASSSWNTYPFQTFFQNGLKITVNTDNRTVSHTSMKREMKELKEHCAMTKEQEERILMNSIHGSFAEDAVKEILYRKVKSAINGHAC